MDKTFIGVCIGLSTLVCGQNTHFNFTEQPYMGIARAYINSAVSTGNVNGKKSILVMGRDAKNTFQTNLYFFNGLTFERNPKEIFTGLAFGEAKFYDFNNDKELDIIIAGKDASKVGHINYYQSKGSGNFTLWETFEEEFDNPSMSIADYNNDGLGDIIVMGNRLNTKKNTYYPDTQVYSYSSDISGFVAKGLAIKDLKNGDVEFFDINQDNQMDLIICGEDSAGKNYLYTYIQKNGNFEETQSIELNFTNPKLAIGDYNNDTYPDFALMGTTSATQPAPLYIYENGKNNQFTINKLINNDLLNIDNQDFAHFADLDTDGDLDFIITGRDVLQNSKLYILENKKGNISDEKQTIAEIGGMGSIALLDLDNDTDLDIFVTGLIDNGYASKILINNAIKLAVNEVKTQSIQVFPSIVNDIFSLNSAVEKLEIYDMNGRFLRTFNNQKEYNISDFEKGIYLLNIKMKDKQEIIKIIKQ